MVVSSILKDSTSFRKIQTQLVLNIILHMKEIFSALCIDESVV